jgi:hypothetical protein
MYRHTDYEKCFNSEFYKLIHSLMIMIISCYTILVGVFTIRLESGSIGRLRLNVGSQGLFKAISSVICIVAIEQCLWLFHIILYLKQFHLWLMLWDVVHKHKGWFELVLS